MAKCLDVHFRSSKIWAIRLFLHDCLRLCLLEVFGTVKQSLPNTRNKVQDVIQVSWCLHSSPIWPLLLPPASVSTIHHHHHPTPGRLFCSCQAGLLTTCKNVPNSGLQPHILPLFPFLHFSPSKYHSSLRKSSGPIMSFLTTPVHRVCLSFSNQLVMDICCGLNCFPKIYAEFLPLSNYECKVI